MCDWVADLTLIGVLTGIYSLMMMKDDDDDAHIVDYSCIGLFAHRDNFSKIYCMTRGMTSTSTK